MKSINFVTTLNRHQQRALHRWYYISLFLMATTIIGIIALQAKQLHELYQEKKEHASIKDQTIQLQVKREPCKQLQQQKDDLQKKQTKIERVTHALSTTQRDLNALFETCNNNVQLQSCSLNKKNFELTASCNHARLATDYMQKLRSNIHFQTIKLISLQQSEQGNSILFTIRGVRKRQ